MVDVTVDDVLISVVAVRPANGCAATASAAVPVVVAAVVPLTFVAVVALLDGAVTATATVEVWNGGSVVEDGVVVVMAVVANAV